MQAMIKILCAGTLICSAGALADADVPADSVKPVTAYPGGKWSPGPARYATERVTNVPIRMDDGVVLRASVVYPVDPASGKRADGPFPVIVEHTPYVGATANPQTYFSEHGYIYVAVQVRGAGASEGELQRFTPREAEDGKAIVDWASHRLDHSDGRVGLLGCSYPGVVALNTAARLGPGSPVKAIVAVCAGLSLNRATMMVAGLPTTSFWNFIPRGTSSMGGTAAADRFFSGMEAEMKAGGDIAYERDFWLQRANMSLTKDIARAGMPILQWSGWRDTNNAVALRTFAGLQNAHAGRPFGAPLATGQRLTPRYQILMGDGEHGQHLDRGVILEWFDTWIKGVDTGIQRTTTPIHFFEQETGRWVNLARFPAVAHYTGWNLTASGQLTRAAAGAGSQTLALGYPVGPGSKLAFSTPSLARGATISGPISASIYARSNRPNLRLIAKLYDVAPGGNSQLLTTGVVLGSQHQPDPTQSWKDAAGTTIWPWPRLDRDRFLEPGRAYRFDVPLEPQHRAILPGHSLRLELTTTTPASICPPVEVPAANNNDVCRETGPQAASLAGGRYTILYGPKFPSALHLPQLSFKGLPATTSGPAPSPQRPKDSFTIPLDWGG